MNPLSVAVRVLVVLALLSLDVRSAGRAAGDSAVSRTAAIDSVRGRTVRVRVPAGYDSVTLERCTSVRLGQWQVVGTKATARTAGAVTFELPAAVSRRFLRVKGNIAVNGLAGARLFLADPALTSGGPFGIQNDAVKPGTGALALASSANAADSSATRTVSESDIWRLAGDRLYFFNELRGLQVFDVANPDDPALLGQMRAAGNGEEMYLLDATHVVLLTRGTQFLTLRVTNSFAPYFGSNETSSVVVADVSKGVPTVAATVEYRGSLRESRLVGAVLYVVSEVWDHSAAAEQQHGLEVTSFDLSDPAHPVKRDTLFLGNWGGVITATDRFLFVVHYSADWRSSVIDIVDISSPTGVLVKRGHIDTAGAVNDKFKMHLDGATFTAISAIPRQWREGQWANGIAPEDASRTMVETFSLANPDAPVKLGALELGVGETVRATRFDDQRLYVVTFFQIDPLWVVDLSRPAAPTLLGELEVPGFSNYILPLGDRLVGIGRVEGKTAVSLFDVSDPAHPAVLSQLPLGDGYSYSEANWTEKAFNVMPEENLIVVPYSGYEPGTGYANRVQLIDLNRNELKKRGVVEQGFAARRTAVKGNRLLAISATDLVTVNFTDRDKPVVTSDVEIAWRVDRVFLAGDHLVQIGGAADWNSARQQTLTISTAAAPDTALTAVQLDAVPVVGASQRDGRLYVAQYKAAYYTATDSIVGRENTNESVLHKASITLSIFDLTNLPAIPRLAQTTSEVDLGYTNELTAAWPGAGVLVWVRQQAFRWGWPYPIFGDIGIALRATPVTATASGANTAVTLANSTASSSAAASNQRTSPAANSLTRVARNSGVAAPATGTVAASSLRIAYPWWNYSTDGPEAVVFDVSNPAAPTLAARLDLRTGSTGEWSEPFAAAGKLYVSSVAYEDFVTIGDKTTNADSTPSRRNRHFLKVVSFADPTKPVTAPDVNIPGKLLGISNAGARLYTVGCRYAADGTPAAERAIHASNFDGTAATFVDQIALTNYDDTYALDGDTVLIGLRANDPKPSRIAAWQLDTAGKFQLASENADPNIGPLSVVRGLLVVGSYGTRHLYDVTDAAHFRDLGVFPNLTPSYWYHDLRKADGSPTRGLWEPLGNYGVNFILFPK